MKRTKCLYSVVTIIGLAFVGCGLLWAGECLEEFEDFNRCGNVHPITQVPATERIAYVCEDRDCCGSGRRQRVTKEWWDWNLDGKADCEYRMWTSLDDPTCPMYPGDGNIGPLPG